MPCPYRNAIIVATMVAGSALGVKTLRTDARLSMLIPVVIAAHLLAAVVLIYYPQPTVVEVAVDTLT